MKYLTILLLSSLSLYGAEEGTNIAIGQLDISGLTPATHEPKHTNTNIPLPFITNVTSWTVSSDTNGQHLMQCIWYTDDSGKNWHPNPPTEPSTNTYTLTNVVPYSTNITSRLYVCTYINGVKSITNTNQ